MAEKKDRRYIAALVVDILAALVLWAVLIILRGVGVVDMHWALVLSSLVWLSWLLFALTAIVAGAVRVVARLKKRYRQRKIDQRIKRQVQAIGLWDHPQRLGGRALEIYAWEWHGLKRLPKETDKELRYRCLRSADKEYENLLKKQNRSKGESAK